MFTEVDSVSQDGKTLTQMVKDTTEAETVTIETQSHRLEGTRAGAHTISGIWKAFKASRSLNGSLIKYTCTKDSFSAETPLGERYTAKFDGQWRRTFGGPRPRGSNRFGRRVLIGLSEA